MLKQDTTIHINSLCMDVSVILHVVFYVAFGNVVVLTRKFLSFLLSLTSHAVAVAASAAAAASVFSPLIS